MAWATTELLVNGVSTLLSSVMGDISSVANGKGASLVGVEDSGTLLTATDVEGALAEIAAVSSVLDSTANGEGASLVGIEDAGTLYTATDVEAALAEVKALADASTTAALTIRTVTVDEEALSGASQAVNVGAALPANAKVLWHEIVVNEQGVLAGNDLTITLGGTDADAIVASTDLDALAVGVYAGTAGTHPQGDFGGQQLVATFAASDLATLSAGNWTINVCYAVIS